VKYPGELGFNVHEASPGVLTFQIWKVKIPTPIECGSEFSFIGSVFDKQVASSHIEKTYNTDSRYKIEKIGDKTVKIMRKVPGMCGNDDEIIFKDSTGRFIALFHLLPSESELSPEYKKIFNQTFSTFKFIK